MDKNEIKDRLLEIIEEEMPEVDKASIDTTASLADDGLDSVSLIKVIVDAEKNGAQFSTKNDSRITKVGKFIRATRLDELPQLLNILKGDMSIVGPRPERQTYIDEFCQETPEFIYRLKVKAGLTGYAQIYGKYNTTPLDKLKLDLMYIESYSVLLDIRLIFLTLKIMFTKESTEGVEEGQNHA